MVSEIKDSVITDIIKDKNKQFVLLKAQKLATALYLVSDFISDSDPLKWKLRDRALAAMSDIGSFNFMQGRMSVSQLVQLIEVALSSRLVSEMNFSLLKQEYLTLCERVTEIASSKGLDLGVEFPSGSSTPVVAVVPVLRITQKTAKKAVNEASRGNRREIILNLIKKNGGQSGVGAIGAALPELSSKTVQRELVQMVSLGQLKKLGAKRWSRYALV